MTAMSGETEADISAWTIDSLRYHLEQQAAELDRRHEQRFEAQEKAVAAAFAAQEKAVAAALAAQEKAVAAALASQKDAVNKAEAAQDKRLEGMNEIRDAMKDQQATYLHREEYRAAHIALVDKVDTGLARLSDRAAVLENRINLMTGQAVGSQEAKATQRLDNGQLVAVVSTVLAAIAIAVTLILALNG